MTSQSPYVTPQSPYMIPSSHAPPYPVSGQFVSSGLAHPQLAFSQYTMVPHGALQPPLQEIPSVAAAINQTAPPPPLIQHLPSPARMDTIPAGKVYQQSLSRPSQAEETLPQEHFQESIIREATPPIQTIQSSVQSKSMRPQALQPSARPVSPGIISNQKSALQRTPDHTSGQQRHLATTQTKSSKPPEAHQISLKQGPHNSEEKIVEPRTAILPLHSGDVKDMKMHGDKILSSNSESDSVSKLPARALPTTTTEIVNLNRDQNVSTHVPTDNPPEDQNSAQHDKSDNLGGGHILDEHPTHAKPQPSPSPKTDMNQPPGGPPVDQQLLMTHTQELQPELVQGQT
jgi:hypothetical protein